MSPALGNYESEDPKRSFMKQNKGVDMTKGNLALILVRFTIPLILSGLLQQLYSWADAFILGNIAGEKALAATGVTGSITMLYIMAITGFTSGVSILSARYMGQGNQDIQKRILSSFLLVTGAIFLLVSVITFSFVTGIIRLLGTPADIFDLAVSYLSIIVIGVPFLAIFNVYSAVLRGIGNSRAPFYAVLLSSALNVALDLLFVGSFHWGVKGAAIATVISQILMTLYIIGYSVSKYSMLRIPWGAKLIDTGIVKEGISLSLPITIQSIVSSAGSLILQNFTNSFGTTTVAAITAAYRVDCILLIPIINLGTGIATVTSQNIGAQKMDRVRQCAKIGLILTTGVSACLTAFVLVFGASTVRMFGVSEEAVQIGGGFFTRIALFYLAFGIIMAMRGFLEGSGRVVISGVVAIIGLGIRIGLSYLLRPVFGNMVIAWAEGFAWTFQAIVYSCFVIRMIHKNKQDFPQQATTNPDS